MRRQVLLICSVLAAIFFLCFLIMDDNLTMLGRGVFGALAACEAFVAGRLWE